MNTYRVSPRMLGKMNTKSFCPRCFKVEVDLTFHTPFPMPMPGLMNNLDHIQKNFVETYFEEKQCAPKWLSALKCAEPISFPAKMTMEFPKYQITMVGKPDAVFRRSDDSLVLVDYKSAKYKGEYDPFLPCYEAQLLGYTHLLEANGIGKVNCAALVYFENQLTAYKDDPLALFTADGITVPFSVNVHPVEIDRKALFPMLKSFRSFVDMVGLPEGVDDCQNCERLNKLWDMEMRRRNSAKSLRNVSDAVRRALFLQQLADHVTAITEESHEWTDELTDDELALMESTPSPVDL